MQKKLINIYVVCEIKILLLLKCNESVLSLNF